MNESRKLTLHIDGQRITADRFRRAVDAFFDLVTDVATVVTGESKAIDWVVSVGAGSINLAASGEARKPSTPVTQVVYAVYSGFQELAKKSPERPAYFTDNALEKTRDLIRLQDGKGVSTIQVRRSRSRVTLNQKVLQNIERLLGSSLAEMGAIEGKLEMVSFHGGLQVGVWDLLTDKMVRCNVTPDLEPRVMAALKKRVSLSGKIRYRSNGDAISIDADDIEIFPDTSQLPTADAVYGILSKV
jgi:hypothetical protein